MDATERELEPTPIPGTFEVVTAASTLAQSQPAKRLPSLLRNRDYMLMWSGQLISVTGTRSTQIIYPLLILDLTNSPAAAGFAAALYALPYLILSLPAGALTDRVDRKRVMIGCDIGRALALLSIPLAMYFGILTIWQIYLASLVDGALFVFFNMAEVAALVRVVAKEQLPQAAAQNDIADSVAVILGPSLGTLLYQIGKAIPFLFDSVTYVFSALSLWFIRTQFQSERKKTPLHLVAEIREGLGWLWQRPLLRYMALLTGAALFVDAASPLLFIVLAKNLGASDAEIGLIFGISAIGVILGALLGGQIQKRFPFGQAILATIWISALLFPLRAIVPQLSLLGIVTGVWWMTMPIYNVIQFSYRIALIPDALQGRVNSVYRLLALGPQPVGAFLAGVLIERFNVYVAVAFFAIWYVVWAIATTFNRNVRNARPIGQASAG